MKSSLSNLTCDMHRFRARSSILAELLLCGSLVACSSPSDPGTETDGVGGTAAGGGYSTGGAFATGGAAVGGSFAAGGAGNVGGSGGASQNTGGLGSGGEPIGSGGASTGGDGSGGDVASGGSSTAHDPCPTPPQPCKIMASGDSITVGAQSTDTGGYRVPLFHLTYQAGQNMTFVGPSGAGPATVDGVTFPENHDGHSGYFIDRIGTRKGLLPLMAPNLAKFSPHIVLLMIGTNDINTQLELSTAPTRLASVIDTVTESSPNTLLVVAKLVPTRTDSLNSDVQKYNAAMEDLVADRVAAGKHVLLVDMYGAFTKNSNYKNALLFDGLHPNDAGYAVMADVWYDAISEYLH